VTGGTNRLASGHASDPILDLHTLRSLHTLHMP
jgi:hypothetical protein